MCRTKTRIYNSVRLGAEFMWWTRTSNTRGDLQKYWSSFLMSEMFNNDRKGEDEERGKAVCLYVFVSFFLCVSV